MGGLIFILLLVCIVLGPVGALVRVVRFIARPADYVRSELQGNQRFSLIHDLIVMVFIPLSFIIVSEGAFAFFETGIGYASLTLCIVVVVIAYFAGISHKELYPPLTELLILLLMGCGIAINLLMMYREGNVEVALIFGAIGHLPVICLCGLLVYRRHRMFQLASKQENVLGAHHADILDYLPDRTVENEYVVNRGGWEEFLWWDGWLKLLASLVFGGLLVGGLFALGEWAKL